MYMFFIYIYIDINVDLDIFSTQIGKYLEEYSKMRTMIISSGRIICDFSFTFFVYFVIV